MKSKIFPFAWLICHYAAVAQIRVDIDPGVAAFKDRVQNGQSQSHRSGKSDKDSSLFPASLPETTFPDGMNGSSASAAQNWRSGSLAEYDIIDEHASDELKGFFKSGLHAAKLTVYSYQESENISRFSVPFDSTSLYKTSDVQLTVPNLIASGISHAGKHLKPFKGKIEFENHEVGYMNGKIASVSVRFRRIFEGGIVRRNVSYAYVKMDGAGRLKEVEFKWPKFIKRTQNLPAISLDEALFQAKQRFAGLPPVSDGLVTVNPLEASVLGMSMGWCPIEMEGKSLLSPCYAFSGEIQFEKGVAKTTLIDIPAYSKYQGQ